MIDLIPFCLSVLISSGLTLYLTEKTLVLYEDINKCMIVALTLEAELDEKTATIIVSVCGCASLSVALESGIIDKSQLICLIPLGGT